MPKQKSIGIKPEYNKSFNITDPKGIAETDEYPTVTMHIYDTDEDSSLISRTYDLGELPELSQYRLMAFGLNQLDQTRTSGVSDPANKPQVWDQVWETLCKGEWNLPRQAGSRTVRIEIEAMARAKDTSVAVIQKSLKEYGEKHGKDAVAELLASDKLKPYIKEIEAERASQGGTVDLDDLI